MVFGEVVRRAVDELLRICGRRRLRTLRRFRLRVCLFRFGLFARFSWLRCVRAFAEEFRQRFLEIRAEGQMLLCGEDDETQFGHRTFFGLQVDRLDIEERAANRDDEQVAATHARALLIPERELT